MRKLTLNPAFYISADADGIFRCGEIFHIAHNQHGGAISTPIGRYFAWRPDIGTAELFHPHWRIDCFVRTHPLAPDAEWLGKMLANELIKHGAVSEPAWVSWYSATEIAGEARGEVFNFD